MISLTNYDFQWARSELVIIYPDQTHQTSKRRLIRSNDLHDTGGLQPVPTTPRDLNAALAAPRTIQRKGAGAGAFGTGSREMVRRWDMMDKNDQTWTKCDSKTWEQFSDLSDFGKLRQPKSGALLLI